MYRVLTMTLAALLVAAPAYAQAKDVLQGGPKPQITPKAPPIISFQSQYGPGTILIDTKRRRLVYTLSGGRAYLYPITVGRLGFQWSGTHRITAGRLDDYGWLLHDLKNRGVSAWIVFVLLLVFYLLLTWVSERVLGRVTRRLSHGQATAAGEAMLVRIEMERLEQALGEVANEAVEPLNVKSISPVLAV